MDSLPNQKLNPTSSKDVNIEAIISAPLTAVSKANANMVAGQTKFLLEYCFTKTVNNTYDPIMITMSYTKSFIDSDKNPSDPGYFQQQQLTFAIPLLSIIPFNSLAIDKMTLDFDLEITSTVMEDPNNIILDDRVQLNGKLSTDPKNNNATDDQYKTKTTSSLKVNLNASSLPLPVGLLTILDLYSKAIQPTPAIPPATVTQQQNQ